MAEQTVRVTLAEKPRDLLVSLVDDGPQTALELSRRFGGGSVHTGGLMVLRKLGLAHRQRRPDHERWEATADGRRLIKAARSIVHTQGDAAA